MVELEISDIEVGENSGYICCKDEDGFTYRFSTNYEKAKLILLLLHGVYVPSNGVYELIFRLLDLAGLKIQYVVITDGYKNRAIISITDGNISKALPISIDDALVISLLANIPVYLKKKACFLEIEELENYFWYRFLKELDLC